MPKTSRVFAGSEWDYPYCGDLPVKEPNGGSLATHMAELAWFELLELDSGQAVHLHGLVHDGQFWKVEDSIHCLLPDGQYGVYTHVSDVEWRNRRQQEQDVLYEMEEDDDRYTD
jgi:hypothetical protein